MNDVKELARNFIVSGRQMKQFEKQNEEFIGMLHASERAKNAIILQSYAA